MTMASNTNKKDDAEMDKLDLKTLAHRLGALEDGMGRMEEKVDLLLDQWERANGAWWLAKVAGGFVIGLTAVWAFLKQYVIR